MESTSSKDLYKKWTKVHEENAGVFQNEITSNEVAEYYTTWANEYEVGFHLDGLYLGPAYVADTLGSVYDKNRESVHILDVAAGTGILGEKLHDMGFLNIDGLDPSPGMLDICRKKDIYSKLICDFITENPSDIETDTYDCIGISGGLGPGHIPRSALLEMIRIVKPGGYICIAMRQEYIEMAEEYNNNKLDDVMLQHEISGLWKKIERRIVPNYFYNKPGVLFFYQCL